MAARVTPHQSEVFKRIAHLCRHAGNVKAENVGSLGACRKLEEKGLITSEVYKVGARGRQFVRYSLTDAGKVWAGR